MHQLNQAVVDHLEKRLLDPARLETLMDQLLNRRDEWTAERRLHVAEMERRATEAEAKLTRLYEAIENGLADMGDASLKTRIADLTTIRDQARGDAERAVTHIERIGPEITPQTLGTFARAVRRKLRHEDGTYARNQIRAVAQRVEVISKTDVRIRGNRTELLRTLTAASGVEAAVLGTRGFGPKWCRLQETCHHPSKQRKIKLLDQHPRPVLTRHFVPSGQSKGKAFSPLTSGGKYDNGHRHAEHR